jgi:N-acetylmuramoyl-L-alanine amidase
MLVMHYTGLRDVEKAIAWLAQPESNVSCHYVIDETGAITQMVAEEMRAWHAGVACWSGEDDINSCSIGIEIHNSGHEHGYPEFPPAQMQAVLALSREIVARHGIRPERVLAHSDVAPLRKIDPGEKFDWSWLAKHGLGHWVAPAPATEDAGLGIGDRGDFAAHAQRLLAQYGYGILETGEIDSHTELVLRAFQRHFRPERIDGRLDQSTLATLERLVKAMPCLPQA